MASVEKKIARAHEIVLNYAKSCNTVGEGTRENVVDLINDLMHLADSKGISVPAMAKNATKRFLSELENEADDDDDDDVEIDEDDEEDQEEQEDEDDSDSDDDDDDDFD